MDTKYDNLANRIKTYLKENNLGDFTKEDDEEKYGNFLDTFSPEHLANLEGKEVRDRIFYHDSDKSTLSYNLEYSEKYGLFCGAITGGSAYKYYLFKKMDTGKWMVGSSNKNRIVDEEESIDIAISIRDAIVNGADYISKTRLDSVEDYVALGKALKDIFKNCPANPDNSWIHKYYSIIFPNLFPIIHQDKMKKNMILKLHMEPLRDFWANDGQLALLSRSAGIRFYSLFDENIVSLFYKWDNHMWRDEFNRNNMVGDDSFKYWAFAPGYQASKFDLCYDNSVMAVGWNYLGDLSQYDDGNFDNKLGEKIKRKEKLRAKPTSAIRSLSAIYKDIRPGDVICVRRGLTKIIAIGKVNPDSKYFYDENLDNSMEEQFYQLRDGISWKVLDDEVELRRSKFLRDTIYEITDEKILNIIRELDGEIPEKVVCKDVSFSRNLIYFGAPGTGKSYNLNRDIDNLISGDDYYERVTFHPDYSYANFVGTYKPVSTDEGISYEYVPGPFMRMLVKAYRNPEENHLLVIEEINRANVAAVFGDVFQLLDRDKSGNSRYPIETSEDVRKYMQRELGNVYTKIEIPDNLYIWATMNSADQGVFSMDTAFKRRWDFKHFGIDNDEHLIEDISVDLNGVVISWNELRKAINEELLNYKINEDKLLGPFFAFDEYVGESIPVDVFKNIFKNKILMYLFEDVARSKRNVLFSGVSGKNNLIYSRICDEFDKRGVEIFCNNISDQFIGEDGE